jgi:hypothetical protein
MLDFVEDEVDGVLSVRTLRSTSSDLLRVINRFDWLTSWIKLLTSAAGKQSFCLVT